MKAQADWLLRELPALVRDGVLDAAVAERLRLRYAVDATTGAAWGRALFPVLGTMLIGLGVILLVAHNWDQLPRPARLGLACAPLLSGQLACAWALLRAPGSTVWREASAAFTVLAFAAALALVGQIYHFPGDLDRFLLTCGLMALPLVYLLDASLAAVLAAAAFAGWVFASPLRQLPLPLFAVAGLYALLLPHVWPLARRAPDGLRVRLLLAALVPLFFAAMLVAFPDAPRLGLWWLAELGGILVALDAQREDSRTAPWRRPLSLYGGMATVAAALIGSFPDVWRSGFWHLPPARLPEVWALLAAGLALLLVLAWRAWRRGNRLAAMQAFPALLMALVAATDSRPLAIALALLLSVYVLALGLAMVRQGLRQRHAGLATRGLFLVALLVLLRFVDTEWSFTVRGLAFVLTGAAFIAANLWLRRQVRT